MILAIMEIATNSKYYGMVNSTGSRIFWEVLESIDDLNGVFGNFKAETLRKYWRLISAVKEDEKIINIINEHQKEIDNPLLK